MTSRFTFLLLCLFCSVTITFAQLDRTREGFSIKPSDSTLNGELKLSLKINPLVGLSHKDVKHKLNYRPIKDSFKKTIGVDMTAKSTLVQKKGDIKQKFNEDLMYPSQYRKDYYLGDLATKSKTITLKCRDHGAIDGDMINILHDKAIVDGRIILNHNFYSITIELKEGFNTISFLALNNGGLGVNTAQLQILDENDNILTNKFWFIAARYKANLVILKE